MQPRELSFPDLFRCFLYWAETSQTPSSQIETAFLWIRLRNAIFFATWANIRSLFITQWHNIRLTEVGCESCSVSADWCATLPYRLELNNWLDNLDCLWNFIILCIFRPKSPLLRWTAEVKTIGFQVPLIVFNRLNRVILPANGYPVIQKVPHYSFFQPRNRWLKKAGSISELNFSHEPYIRAKPTAWQQQISHFYFFPFRGGPAKGTCNLTLNFIYLNQVNEAIRQFD